MFVSWIRVEWVESSQPTQIVTLTILEDDTSEASNYKHFTHFKIF